MSVLPQQAASVGLPAPAEELGGEDGSIPVACRQVAAIRLVIPPGGRIRVLHGGKARSGGMPAATVSASRSTSIPSERQSRAD